MWYWRKMEKISWTGRVRNEEVLHTVKEERNLLHEAGVLTTPQSKLDAIVNSERSLHNAVKRPADERNIQTGCCVL
jgi:hypothetical protein